MVNKKKSEVIDGYTIKYHADGNSVWSKGKIVEDQPDGYWEWGPSNVQDTSKMANLLVNG